MLSWFRSYLTDRYQFLSLFGHNSNEFAVSSGVPKECIHYADLKQYFNKCSVLNVDCNVQLFAGNIKLFYVSIYESVLDCTRLQKSLRSLVIWCNAVRLDLTIQKCKIMAFNRTSSELKYVYYIGNHSL